MQQVISTCESRHTPLHIQRLISRKAYIEMGLSGDADDTKRRPTASNDVFRLEIPGIYKEHLSERVNIGDKCHSLGLEQGLW